MCVYCGSRPGNRPEYSRAAVELGRALARRRIRLVYGGASVGLMGKVADAVLEGGGEVVGILPRWLEAKEVGHPRLTELHLVDTMHTRKARMIERADAFIALPGGLGTYDELFEVLTWSQVGLHEKPIGLLDVAGYFGPLRALVRHTVAEGFATSEHEGLFVSNPEPDALLDDLIRFERPIYGSKWVDGPEPRREP
ncbi:MAG TPA: TIGR00730 family Rossman fold protein [Polyangiaceae bacterium]|nr:TIGR00730 family Rossman fold protein [Polyangiaceae bacterium]